MLKWNLPSISMKIKKNLKKKFVTFSCYDIIMRLQCECSFASFTYNPYCRTCILLYPICFAHFLELQNSFWSCLFSMDTRFHEIFCTHLIYTKSSMSGCLSVQRYLPCLNPITCKEVVRTWVLAHWLSLFLIIIKRTSTQI